MFIVDFAVNFPYFTYNWQIHRLLLLQIETNIKFFRSSILSFFLLDISDNKSQDLYKQTRNRIYGLICFNSGHFLHKPGFWLSPKIFSIYSIIQGVKVGCHDTNSSSLNQRLISF